MQKAERQAREAQIETALERVRAVSMAMHKSEDLPNVASMLVQQLNQLKIEQLGSSIIITAPDQKSYLQYSAHDNLKDQSEILNIVEGPDPHSFWLGREILSRANAGERDFTIELTGKHLTEWMQFTKKHIHPERGKTMLKANIEKIFFHFAIFHEASQVVITTLTPLHEPDRVILRRLADTFSQSYTRFLDLQRAELQAREAQLEVTLERIRNSATAMRHSRELPNVALTFLQQLEQIEVPVIGSSVNIVNEERKSCISYFADNSSISGEIKLLQTKEFKLRDFWLARLTIARLAKGEREFSIGTTPRRLEQWIKWVRDYLDPQRADRIKQAGLNKVYFHVIQVHENSNMIFSSVVQLNTAHWEVIRRMTNSFAMAYRRFLDLQKAEEQAREAEIEVSLERVRAKAMAMNSPSDLTNAVSTFLQELQNLDLAPFRCSLGQMIDKEAGVFEVHASSSGQKNNRVNAVGQVKVGEAKHKVLKGTFAHWKDQKEYFPVLKGKEINAYHREVNPQLPILQFSNNIIQYGYFYMFSEGALSIWKEEKFEDEELNIYRKFGSVLSLTFNRYIDLIESAKRARQSSIEASLERVRAQAMAMHHSKDLGSVAQVVFQELDTLDLEIMRCGIGIINGETQTVNAYIISSDSDNKVLEVSGDEPLTGHPLLDGIFAHWKMQKPFTYKLKGEDLVNYYKAVASTEFQKPVANKVLENPSSNQYYHCAMFPAGGLFAFKEKHFTDENLQVLRRFSEAFHLAYTRFEDLQKSEERAREAIKEASLDRVRAEIASMRTSEDLEKITPLIWKELTVLGIPFFRCGVFIVDEIAQNVQVLLTTPSGESQTSMVLPFGSSDVLNTTIKQWKKQDIFHDLWSKERFVAWTNSVVNQGYVKSSDEYRLDREVPDQIALHFLPFSQGMLYIGSKEPLHKDYLEAGQSLAKAFSVAYARYEDFTKLDEAKTRVESTLKELQAAQDQLIHSEKMASLGELTAGIAHEIQNPLNFVNNFSAVSNELIAEAKEELEKGDIQEATEILSDLIINLDKINHHGERASSIVKGMLDHSRSSTGEKVPTDINSLCDEYVRLAYHGMRARDKSFNVKFETDFQDDLPLIKITPQDIGRVILNLVNNAFQACQEKAKTKTKEFGPLVKISTETFSHAGGDQGEELVGITVSDNGPGIPDEIKDKIFQPFFTTKSTGQGTGLGLSLSYDIVKAHGGMLKVESEVGTGTIFKIQIPIKW